MAEVSRLPPGSGVACLAFPARSAFALLGLHWTLDRGDSRCELGTKALADADDEWPRLTVCPGRKDTVFEVADAQLVQHGRHRVTGRARGDLVVVRDALW